MSLLIDIGIDIYYPHRSQNGNNFECVYNKLAEPKLQHVDL